MRENEKQILNEDTYPWWARVLEWVLLRVVYFIITFAGGILIIVMLTSRMTTHFFSAIRIFESPTFWVALTVLSALLGFFGPWIYERHKNKGRGRLQNVKAAESGADIAREMLGDEDKV